MNVREIGELIKAGKITIDDCGHSVNDTTERFIGRYDDIVANSLGANDGKWQGSNDNRTPEEWDARMREFHNRMLDLTVEIDDSIGSEWKSYCFGCGQELGLVYNGDRLTLRYYYSNEASTPLRTGKILKGGFVNHPLDYRCPYENPQPFTGKIAVADKLVFANFFRSVEDCPEDEKYGHEYDLNCLRGRENITKYKSARNVAYGQMGNMSVAIFVNDAKDSIIVGNAYMDDYLWNKLTPEEQEVKEKEYESRTDEEELEDEDNVSINGHKFAGRICLDVWRWEAADMLTIANDMARIKEDDRDHVIVDAKQGIWSFEQLFHRRSSDDEMIYATLKWTE
jgi:hypothetical protein